MGNCLYNWQTWIVGIAVIIIIIWVVSNYRTDVKGVIETVREIKNVYRPSDELMTTTPTPARRRMRDNSAYKVIMESSRDCVPRTAGVIGKTTVDITPSLPQGITSEDWEDDSKRTKGEKECQRVMEKIYGVPFGKANPVNGGSGIKLPWLKNNLPGGRLMEIDVYNDQLKIGVEYNGEQHYKFPHYYNPTIEKFIDQCYRDEIKVNLCDANGVYLITVPYNVPLKDIEGFIRYYLPDAVMARQKRMEQLK